MNNQPEYIIRFSGAFRILSSRTTFLSSLFLLVVFCMSNIQAAEIDWDQVETQTIKTFYPGVSSWDFVKSKNHSTGAPPVRSAKKPCKACHVGKDGSYDIGADGIISGELNMSSSGEPFEPEPSAGVNGFTDVSMQVAYDSQHIYLRFQWPGSGASVTDPSVAEDDKADRISVQLANKIKTFRLYGCFITCHDNQSGMPGNRGEDVHLYGYYTRSKGELKPQETLDGYLSKGQLVDLWIATFEGSDVKVSDQYILQDRIKDDQNDLSVTGSFEEGKYTAVFSRKLSTGNEGDIELTDGKVFNIGIAIHDNKNTGRKHYTSFPVSVGLSTGGDITAQKF